MRTMGAAMGTILSAGGPFTGDNKPVTRITVQPNWWLNVTSGPVGNRASDKLPIRYWQTQANTQTEIEIPYIKTCIIDRSLDQQAATIEVDFYNLLPPTLGVASSMPDVYGEPGYFSWARGGTPEAQARWNQTTNSWTNLLRENALLRVYQGYGGAELTLPEALEAGNVILNGVFLIDSVALEASGGGTGSSSGGSGGLGKLIGRDMAKLLIDQAAWPPLVPQAFYTSAGIVYYQSTLQTDAAVPGYGTGSWASQRAVYEDSSQAAVNGPTEAAAAAKFATDGNIGTNWLSELVASPADQVWIEFSCNEEISGVYLAPYLGNYTCYVSILESGAWQGGGSTVAGVPYVTQFGVPYNTAAWYALPQRYQATTVRFTFTNLSAWPGGYLAGLKEVQLGSTGTITQTNRVVMDMIPTPNGGGYALIGSDGGVFNYGNSQFFGSLAGTTLVAGIIGGDKLSATDGAGYWLAGADGGVFTFGAATFYGSLGDVDLAAPIVGFRCVPGGGGYYMVGADGGVFTFGSAVFHGSGATLSGINYVDITIKPDNSGYWLLSEDGNIQTFGGAVNHGNGPLGGGGYPYTGMDCTATGDGYWLTAADGGVYAFGDAVDEGGMRGVETLLAPISGLKRNPASSNTAYWLVGEDGGVFTLGSPYEFWGSLPGAFQFSAPGNYADYADIVTDFLLWSGWFLFQSVTGAAAPPVFGNIQKTGAYNSVGPIDPSTWDKQQIIDCITQVTQIVGFLFRIDETGAARFTLPNWWSSGNFLDNGTPTTLIPVLQENQNVTDYVQTTSDTDLRSEIIVASQDPYLYGGHPNSVLVTRYTPPNINSLHGIVKPAMIGVPLNVPISQQDQDNMAELLALQIWFAQRQGQTTCVFDPTICVDDQVQIFERTTGETAVHYVRGIHTEHDLDQGTFTCTYTTNWLGDRTSWAITATGPAGYFGGSAGGAGSLTDTQYDEDGNIIYEKTFGISTTLQEYLANTESPAVTSFLATAGGQLP